MKIKMKNKTIAQLLTITGLFGIAGLQYLYLGKPLTFLLWFFTCGFLGVGTIIDLFTMSSTVDAHNTGVQLKVVVKKQALDNK